MSKTIEEAAREFADENWTWFHACEWDKEYVTDNLEYAFQSGAQHVLSLPLSERLTEDEKERVRDEYWESRTFCENCDPCGESYARNEARMSLLERIFGKEMFEKEGV